MPRMKHRSSRRVPAPEDSDFDHEISLVDHSALGTEEGDSDEGSNPPPTPTPAAPEPPSPSGSSPSQTTYSNATTTSQEGQPQGNGRGRQEIRGANEEFTAIAGSTTGGEARSPQADRQHLKSIAQGTRVRRMSVESAVDILYENQRGGFLCGMPLFSSRALGNLDPPAWTNAAHKASATDIQTAQVPDPSWEWAWPEWRLHLDEAAGDDGWDYSFMFSKCFSWHGPTWWNSFVRRRAWIRKRVKKDTSYAPHDPLLLNPEYFTVSSVATHSPSPTRVSQGGSIVDAAASQVPDEETGGRPDIEDTESLLRSLRASRIDREKIEAVDNYLERAQDDLKRLQDSMHEIMRLFIFQASRRLLLTRLTEAYEASQRAAEETGSAKLKRRVENLSAAIKHADEEVRKLEYWSDVKAMTEAGRSIGAVDADQGWDEAWQGADRSGPAAPEPEKRQP